MPNYRRSKNAFTNRNINMYTISSYSHSYRNRKTSRGDVIDVIFRVIDETGEERQKVLSGFTSKRLADKAYMEFVSTNCIFSEKNEKYKKTYIKFNEVAKLYLEYTKQTTTAGTAIKRIQFFKNIYCQYFGDKNIESISPADIYKWFDYVITVKKQKGNGNYAPRTLKSMWGNLHTFFTWCSKRYSIKNPMNGLSMPRTKPIEKNITFWELQQFNQFIESVDNILWKTFFTFQFYTGCRVGETLALQEKDYTGTSIIINKSLSKKNLIGERYEIKSTKTGKNRTIPIPQILQNQLTEYIKWKRENNIDSKFLFTGKSGDYLPHTTIRRFFDKYTNLSSVPRIKVHDLRHSYVSLLIHKGANLAVIANLIGDTFEQVTNTYGHMYETDKVRVINLLDS